MLACKDTKEEQKDFSHFGMDVQNSRHAMKVIADKKLFFYYRMLNITFHKRVSFHDTTGHLLNFRNDFIKLQLKN